MKLFYFQKIYYLFIFIDHYVSGNIINSMLKWIGLIPVWILKFYFSIHNFLCYFWEGRDTLITTFCPLARNKFVANSYCDLFYGHLNPRGGRLSSGAFNSLRPGQNGCHFCWCFHIRLLERDVLNIFIQLHQSLFLKMRLSVSQQWFPEQVTTNLDNPVHGCHMVSLGHIELIHGFSILGNWNGIHCK